MVMAFFSAKFTVKRWMGESNKDLRHFAFKVFVCAVAVVQLIYPSIVSTTLSLFGCRHIDTASSDVKGSVQPLTESYWAEDLDVMCSSADFRTVQLALGVPFIVFLVIGYPLLTIMLLLAKARRLQRGSSCSSLFWSGVGFLHSDYHDDYIFWQAVPALQQGAMLVAVLITLQAQTVTGPVVACAALATFFAGVQMLVRPFVAATANRLQLQALLAVQVGFGSGGCL
jgi:hypothetical protein